MTWAAVIILLIVGIGAMGLTLVSLPGTWLLLLVSILCWWLVPGLADGPGGWWWVAGAAMFVLLAEGVEFFASVVGAKAGGAGKHGAWGAFLGGLFGAIAGTLLIPIPIVGTVIGGVAGAGLLAAMMERGGGKKSWKDSTKAGTGAAAGKLFSTVLKSAIAGVMTVMLVVAAAWAGFTAPEPAAERGPDHERPGMLPAETPSRLESAAEPAGGGDAQQGGTDADPTESPSPRADPDSRSITVGETD
ncbi:MAG: DUF456 domain-containing protein [Planctomycetota bacterium]